MNKKTVLKNIAYAIFVITCVLTAIDTGLFVYPSLSRYLLLEAGAMVLSVLCILTNIVYRRDIAIGKLGLFIFAWILYIILHGCLIAETCEQYRTYYLCTTLLLILVAVLAVVFLWDGLKVWLSSLWTQITGEAGKINSPT